MKISSLSCKNGKMWYNISVKYKVWIRWGLKYGENKDDKSIS